MQQTLNQQVVQELRELAKLGVFVPAVVIKKAAAADLSEYKDMSVSEIADLFIALR